MIDPASLAFAALNYTGALVVEHVAEKSLDDVWRRFKGFVHERFGRDPNPADLTPTSEAARALGPELLVSAEVLFSADRTLRRVQLVARVFEGARILWVDDLPKGNTYEAGFLRELGAHVDQVFTTEEAVARLRAEHYDVLISDMDRAGDPTAGLTLLHQLNAATPIVFYVTHLDPERDRPRGSLGIVVRPDDLFNLIMDTLERQRC